MLLWVLMLGAALAAPGDDELERGFRVDDTEGWTEGNGEIRSSDGLSLRMTYSRAGLEPAEQLSVSDIGRERASLVVELAARKLRVVDLAGRVVTTPLGDPMVLVEYGIEPAKDFEGVAPKRGARVTRRCGPTVRITAEGESVASGRVLDAAQQLLWAEGECEVFNPRPFHKTSSLASEAPPPRPVVFAPPPPPRSTGGSWPVVFGVGAVVVLGVGVFVYAGRGGASTKLPAPPSPQPGAAAAAQRNTAPPPRSAATQDEPRRLSTTGDHRGSAAGTGDAARRKGEPRPLGALGAEEGVWVVPVINRPKTGATEPEPPRLSLTTGSPPERPASSAAPFAPAPSPSIPFAPVSAPAPAAPAPAAPAAPSLLSWGARNDPTVVPVPAAPTASAAPAGELLEPGQALLQWLNSAGEEEPAAAVAPPPVEAEAPEVPPDERIPNLAPTLSILLPHGPPLPPARPPTRPPSAIPLAPHAPSRPLEHTDLDDDASPGTLVPPTTLAPGASPEFTAEEMEPRIARSRGGKEDPLLIALRQLGSLVGVDRAPPPHPSLPDVPPGYRAFLELHDGVSFGGAWLRLFGIWEGRGPTVVELNGALAGKIGRRFLIGTFANGMLVLLNARGEVVLARPGVAARQIAPNLTLFLANLAADPPLRQELCDRGALGKWARQAGTLGLDQIYEVSGESVNRTSLVDLWLRSPSLL